MKKTGFFLLALILLAEVIFVGCKEFSSKTKEKEEQSTAYSVYYINADETELVKKAYQPKEETADVMVQEMMRLLKEQKAEGSNLALLPEDVSISTYDIHEKTLTIDFNSRYLKMKPARELLVRAGIVKMFIQVPGIVYVYFTVEGNDLTDSKDRSIGLMSVDTFADQAGKDINSYQYTTLTLYFTNKTGDKLIPEKRSVYYNSNVSLERIVLNQLLEGPRIEKNLPTLPSDVNILGVTSTDGICYVNFDNTFSGNNLAVQESIPIYSVVNSLVDTCKVEQVQISVNGERDLTFRETMRLDTFYEKNRKLIEKQEEEASSDSEATDVVTSAPAKSEAAGK